MPCLLSIYLNGYDIKSHILILSGFIFYAITGNTLNDVIDMTDPNEKETLERVKGYTRKEISVISIASFILGTSCFMIEILDNPLLAIYLILIVFMVVFYCFFKSLVIINHIILGISHIILPWFMIKINAGDIFMNFFPELELSESLILASIICVAFIGQMTHEMIDGDSLSKLKPTTSQLVIWIACLVSLFVAIVSFIITKYLVFLPLVFFPFGIMYIFRNPRNNLLGRTSLKDTGILLGNLMLAYVVILIIAT
jgi:4-hydroxybenzoate polyprenyltransferase